ncbi:hypothetical protein [Conexibacter arvalis]|uniref:Uncharacterized protein n=1 Tax=Conexibacter arvalis TaxID=912552 RepID=A0A840IHL1_9ACTN|nr:hypothetical protein [Conexibacter arvalis]MBB4663450.1 hypothetical protein [Conexibacter arvalis]
MPSVSSPLFDATEPAEVLEELRRDRGELLDALERGLADGLRGSPSGAALYANAVHELTSWLFATASSTGAPAAELLVELVEDEAVKAPFTAWPLPSLHHGDAAALHLVDAVREWIDKPPVKRTAKRFISWRYGDRDAELFARRVRSRLAHGRENDLERLMRVFELSKSELGRLFGVTRQAIDGWLLGGVPADRQEKLASMLALADLLERKLKAGRVPGVARRAADAYGGLTMLEMVAADRHDELLASVRDSFDWARAA